jgi:hypothetical protein
MKQRCRTKGGLSGVCARCGDTLTLTSQSERDCHLTAERFGAAHDHPPELLQAFLWSELPTEFNKPASSIL